MQAANESISQIHSVLEVQGVEQKLKQKCTRGDSLAHGHKKQLKVERENK